MKKHLALVGSLLIACTFPALSHAQCPASFAPAAHFAAGAFPAPVAVGDFNADGRPDLAVANRDSGTVSILLGNPGGTFQAPVNYAAGAFPVSVAVGDFNFDGRPDLALANPFINNVSILLGNPNGTFRAPVNYAAGGNPRSVAVGDFNADGRPDLAVPNINNESPGTVSILMGNPGGTFRAPVNYTVDGGPIFVAVGDFNADGQPDLATANFSGNTASILLGNPPPPNSGTFQAPVRYAVGLFPYSVAVGDFNADGRPDLAVANSSSDNVSILLGNTGGTFQAAVNYAVGRGPTSVAVGDFNADGRPDLAVANSSSGNVSILLGNPGGTFPAPDNFAAGVNSSSVAVGDFNADGRPDLAVANSVSNNVSVLLNTGIFSAPTITQQPGADQLVQAGQNVALALIANGHGNTLTYQWRKDGTGLTNGNRISGADTPALTIASVQSSDQGGYDCHVSNICGSVLSAAVVLSCRPIIAQQPPPESTLAAGLQLVVEVPTGAAYSYRWRQSGQNLFNIPGLFSGVTTRTLNLLVVDASLAGMYDCIITNSCGVTTSAAANVYCPADFNRDFSLDPDDLADYIGTYFGDPPGTGSDFNGDGITDPDDLADYIGAFFAGCG